MNLTQQKDLFKAQNKQNEITKAMMQNIVWQTKQRPHGDGKKKAELLALQIQNGEYQNKLAFVIANSIIEYIEL